MNKSIYNEAAAFYHRDLMSNEDNIQGWLDDCGIRKESIEIFDLGFAKGNHQLTDYLLERGFSVDELLAANLSEYFKHSGWIF